MKTIIIDGNDFSDYDTIYYEIKEIIEDETDVSKEILTLQNMVRIYLGKYNGDVELIWKNSIKSKKDFGYKSTISHLRRKIQQAPVNLIPEIVDEIKKAEKELGPTLFDIIVECFTDNQVQVILE